MARMRPQTRIIALAGPKGGIAENTAADQFVIGKEQTGLSFTKEVDLWYLQHAEFLAVGQGGYGLAVPEARPAAAQLVGILHQLDLFPVSVQDHS